MPKPNNPESSRREAVASGALIAVIPVLVLIAIATPRSRTSKTKVATLTAGMTEPTNGEQAPELDLKGLNGNRVRLSDYAGKVVVINFWATWCAPCRAEIPAFVRLRAQYHDKGLEIIGVSLDEEADDTVNDFARRFNINYPVAIATLDEVMKYGPIEQIPTTFIVDRQGRIVSRRLGMMSFDKIEKAIQPLL